MPEGLEQNQCNDIANQLHSLAVNLLRDARKHDAQSGLTPERLSILSVLVFTGPKTINQLAEMEQVSAPAITRTVKSLEKLGYVIKSRSKNDQRVVYVAATRKSQQTLEDARKFRVKEIANRLQSLDSNQMQQIQNAINILDLE
ncbi:MAG: MarR family transcriptional regulator [Kangiellaceae bacterium]|nr:MarR family transcriptional regulator [Kangiellaceae bacterium]